MATGSPTGPDLALLRELNARAVPFLLCGRVGAAVQGVPLAWSVLDIYGPTDQTLYAAQVVSGHEPRRWPTPPGREAWSNVRAHQDVPGRFNAECRRSVEVVLEGDVPVRAQHLLAIVAWIQELGTDDDAVPVLEAALALRGEPVVKAPYAPETRLGMLYGARLDAVLSVLSAAGYVRSSSQRGGSYSIAYDDVEPHTGARSADVAYREDPARPVAAAIARA